MAWLTAVQAVVGAESQYEQGRIGSANAALQGIQDQRDANDAQVQAQAQAFNERRRAKILRSRALSVAGASGAGVSDPTVTNIMANIDKEGEFRALTALYEGDETARALRSGAASKFRASSAYNAAGNLRAAGSLAEGAYSFFDKYGSGLFSHGGYSHTPSYSDPTMQDIGMDTSLVPSVSFD